MVKKYFSPLRQNYFFIYPCTSYCIEIPLRNFAFERFKEKKKHRVVRDRRPTGVWRYLSLG